MLSLFLISCMLSAVILAEPGGLANNASLLWGPYRPNLYLGIRPRIPNSLLMGLMWSNADKVSDITNNLRHTCEQFERMPSYGWTAYDVRKGGVQAINDTDNKVDLVTEFAKVSDDNWGLRIKGIPREDAKDLQKTSVIFYIGSEDSNATVKCTKVQDSKASSDDVVCDGTMASLNNFKVAFTGHRGDRGSFRRLSVQSLTVPADTIWQAKSIFIKQLAQDGSNEAILPDNPGQGNLHFVQGIFEAEFKFDVLFSSGPDQDVTTSSALTKGVQEALSTFNARFQSVYQPQTPFNDQQHIKFSQALLSNLMGGIGYFYGTSKLDVSSAAAYDETNLNFWEEIAAAQAHAVVEDRGPYQLFSAVPSRPYFPRGFLWDEGFHLQVILESDMDLALDIVASWFAMTSEDGWIAREQILGPEARSKVPPEFLTQYNHYANPPTLFFVIQAFLEKLDGVSTYSGAPSHYLSDSQAAHAYMRVFYIKSVRHYGWFLRKQAGNLKHYKVPGSSGDIKQGYRWRGRTPQHLLTSGLDDYPRAQPPHPEELHVDVLSWVGVMAVVLEKAAVFLKHPIDVTLFSKHVDEVVRSIDAIHWSEPDQAYCDTTIVVGDQVEMVCHKGYVSLFPFLTGLMGANHTHLGAVLNLIRDPEELWTPYGLRSLSPKDKYYGKDENYWRGPIWINMNYMALQRLLEVSQQPGPCQQKSTDIYSELRLNLVNAVFESWNETGFAWEQYNQDTGRGQRTEQFTGWTSLIVKVMNMPDLQPRSQSSIPELIRPSNHTNGWNTILTLSVIGMLVICFIFRKPLMRNWKSLMDT